MKSFVRNMSYILGEKDLVSLVPGVCNQVYRSVCVSVSSFIELGYFMIASLPQCLQLGCVCSF